MGEKSIACVEKRGSFWESCAGGSKGDILWPGDSPAPTQGLQGPFGRRRVEERLLWGDSLRAKYTRERKLAVNLASFQTREADKARQVLQKDPAMKYIPGIINGENCGKVSFP